MKKACPRCALAPLKLNEDGDPSCFICGFVVVDVPAWVLEDDGDRSRNPRLRRPSTQGMKL